jgi:hypothetical protein
MASNTDGDDLTAGQTNHAQSGTELVVDVVELSNANDYLFRVRHEVPSPRVNGISGIAGRFGVAGEGGTAGVSGQSAAGNGVQGTSASGNGVLGTSASGVGVQGTSPVIALQGTGGRIGARGVGTAAGVVGISPPSGTGLGVVGASDTGVLGAGGTVGVDGVSSAIGIRGTCTGGLGAVGASTTGTGVFGTGLMGVHASSPTGFGLVAVGPAGAFSGAGYFVGPVFISGSLAVFGAKSAAVPHADGSHRLLYSLECPESWFEDFGEGHLIDGKAEITLDPEFCSVIRTNMYHVFLTPCGDSHGLYVKRKTRGAFEVREQQNGKGHVKFSYRIVAKRKDIKGERLKTNGPLPPPPKPPKLPKISRPEDLPE